MNRFTFGIVIFAGVAIAAGFLIWPRYQVFSQAEQEKTRKEIELSYHDEYAQKLSRLKKEVEAKKAEIAIADTSLPVNEALPSLYELMGSLTSESGLLTKSMSISPPAQHDSSVQIKSIGISLQAEGSYEAFKQFIENTRRSPRMLTVRSFRLSVSSSENEVFQYAIELEAYSY